MYISEGVGLGWVVYGKVIGNKWEFLDHSLEFGRELGGGKGGMGLFCIEQNIHGAKKIIFTACHSGKLKLAFTRPDVISTSPKNFLTSRIDFTVLDVI